MEPDEDFHKPRHSVFRRPNDATTINNTTHGDGVRRRRGVQRQSAMVTVGAKTVFRNLNTVAYVTVDFECNFAHDWSEYAKKSAATCYIHSGFCRHACLRVVQVCFSVTENTHMSVVGDGVFKMYRYLDGSLRQFAMQKADFPHFVSHAWLTNDLLLAGTIHGRLIVMDSTEYKREYAIFGDNQWDTKYVQLNFLTTVPFTINTRPHATEEQGTSSLRLSLKIAQNCTEF